MNTGLQMLATTPGSSRILEPLKNFQLIMNRRGAEWFVHEKRWSLTRRLCERVLNAFTVHPSETDETYLQHLWFTTKTSTHFVVLGIMLFTHGVFPFLFTRTVSSQIEGIYKMMRARIPKKRRSIIDGEYSI